MACHGPNPSVCDLQHKFRTAISGFSHVLASTHKLLRFADICNLDVLVTTQQRAKLGETCDELELGAGARFHRLVKADVDKSRFSMAVPEVLTALPDKRPVILAGIETHICVLQTALDLLARGHAVYVAADAVSSCNAEERALALARLQHAGAAVSTTESLMYEVVGDAASPQFRALAGLVKETKEATRDALGALCKA